MHCAAREGSKELGQIEPELREAALGCVTHVLGALMSGPLQEAAGVASPPGKRGKRTVEVLTSAGPVSYSRAYVRLPDGTNAFPADELFGIVRGCTPSAAKLLCHEAARCQSYKQASESLALVGGITVSPNTIHRLVSSVGADMERWASEREPAKPGELKDIIICLQTDMTGVRMLKKHLVNVKGKDGDPKGRQIKCATLFLMQRGEDNKYHRLPDTAIHLISFADPVTFSAELNNALDKLGAPFGTKMVVVGDGAEWIWNIVEDRFKWATGIVDFWHAAEHVNELCATVCSDDNERKQMFKLWRRKLKRYGANCLINHFENLSLSDCKHKEVLKKLKYFKTHRERMQYLKFRREGLLIGSGAIEGACKSLVKQRTNLSGQRWSPDGALDILWVRALITDGLHEKYWQEKRSRKGTKRGHSINVA